MSAPPRLSEADIRAEVERIFRRKHRSWLVALYGRGPAGAFELDGRRWQIVPTTCELELREHLPEAGGPPAEGRVFLVDWTESQLPLDVACRLARGQIYHIARDARLAAMFGARQVEPGLAGSAIAKLLLAEPPEGLRKVPGLLLTRDDLCARFLAAYLGLSEPDLASTSALLRWARASSAGPAFLRRCEADETWRAARRELADWLRRREPLGAAAALIWRAWEGDRVQLLLVVLLLLEAGEALDDPYTRGLLGGQVTAWLPELAADLRLSQGAFTSGDLLGAALNLEAEADRRLLDEAERLANAHGLGAVAALSARLPSGHAARERVLAERLEAAMDEPSSEALQRLIDAKRATEAHRLDGYVRTADQREARCMGVRLTLWLALRRVRPQVSPYGSAWQPAVELARRYAEEGGYVDWARQELRGLPGLSEPLARACRRLLSIVDGERREDDRRFAEAYVSWLAAGKPSSEVIPIEHVARRVVAPFLREKPHRRLLLVLMDGMSQASAMQVLQRLSDGRRWGTLAWRPAGWQGAWPVPPVLAVAPTLTELSRTALFAGQADPRFGDEGTGRDEQRWASNADLRAAFGDEPPALFSRRDIQSGRELIPELKAAIRSERRLVGVVVNAIDEQLRGSLQVGVSYQTSPIWPLETMLEALVAAAEGEERAVLLVADHGHVPGDTLRVVSGRVEGGRPSGARWRALREGEEPAPDEVRLPAGGWRPRGWDGVAALWDPSACYRPPNFGEHGGVSLAEVVAPAILVGPDWLSRSPVEDEALTSQIPRKPDWWDLRLPRLSAPASAPPPRAATPSPQLMLIPAAVAPPAPPPPPEPTEAALVSALRGARAFREHTAGEPELQIERVLGWLNVLVQAGDTLPSAEFARLCGVRPHQVGGAVARMGMLNVDGFAIVEHDLAGRRVVLHRARLVQQFGVNG